MSFRYRAKTVEATNSNADSRWVSGYYVRVSDGKKESHRIYSGYAETDVDEFYPDWYEIDPSTLCRYLNAEDFDGNYICIGDVISVRFRDQDIYHVVIVEQDFSIVAKLDSGKFIPFSTLLHVCEQTDEMKLHVVDNAIDTINKYNGGTK